MAVQIHTKSGKTLNFDIVQKSKRDEFNNLIDNPDFAATITGVGILHDGAHHMFPSPKGMQIDKYFSEVLIETLKNGEVKLTGERLFCYINKEGLRMSLTVWYRKQGPRVSSFEVRKIGRKVFDPNSITIVRPSNEN